MHSFVHSNISTDLFTMWRRDPLEQEWKIDNLGVTLLPWDPINNVLIEPIL